MSLLLGICLSYYSSWHGCFLKPKMKTKCKLSRVVTVSDETKIKRICLNSFWFKIGSRGEKRGNANENKTNSSILILVTFHVIFSKRKLQVSFMLTHSSHCWCKPEKTNSNVFSSWMPNTSKHLSSSLSHPNGFQIPKNQAKTSQRHVANLENVPELLKTFTFTTAMPNLQWSSLTQNLKPVHWSQTDLQMSFRSSEGQKHLHFSPNSLLKASNISKFLQWSSDDQILPNCQQPRRKHLAWGKTF